ncbi:beta-mannosidase [Burkholderia cenocepacia]|nr:beta-mannosidase [Burkholderia cenocepacia]
MEDNYNPAGVLQRQLSEPDAGREAADHDRPAACERAPISRVALRIDGWRLDRPNCRLGLGGVPVGFNERALTVDQAVATFASARVATCVRDAADRTRRRPRPR